jgi:hypothetical protein
LLFTTTDKTNIAIRKVDKMIYLVTLLVFISVFIISSYVSDKILTQKYVSNLLLCANSFSENLPAELAMAVIPKSRILRNISLPIPNRDGEEIQIGTLIVTRSGIFILCQLNGSGILENPSTARWKRIENGKFTEFDNPFHSQKDARTLISYYTESSGVSGVKVHTTIIYTSKALRFTHPKPRGVISAEDFVKRLTHLQKHGNLSVSQIRSICSTLRKADSY